MTLELANRSISRPVRVAEYVFVKVGTFHFPADFVVVDFDADPRAPPILRRSFLKTGRAFFDVYEGELTLCVSNKAITFNIDQTLRYSANYDAMSVNRIDLIDVACEEYSQEVLGFSISGNPTPSTKPIVSNFSPTLTPFEDSDFLLEETSAVLAIDDVPISQEIDEAYNKLSIPKLSPTCMTLELANRSISRPVRVAEYVFVKVGTFHFLADFVVIDFDADPRAPPILRRSFLKTGRALIDVYEGELTLCVSNKAITFNIDQTLRYSANYDAMSVNRIDLIDVACEEYSQEVLGFSISGNPTPSTKPIVSN
nr:reverse transcriptase domain-containing protein [Tanacetum cinerariifolium]